MTHVQPKTSSLADLCPELADLWHPSMNGDLSPHDVSVGSARKVWWQCPTHVDHTWESSVVNQRKNPRCPYCAGTKVLTGFNDLSTLFPTIALQFITSKNPDVDLETLSSKSAKKLWWQCDFGHQWQATVFNRTAGRGCPTCSGRTVQSGHTDLLTLFPSVAAQWHPSRNGASGPQHVTAHTHQKVWWLCAEGHEWEASVGSRSKGNGCPYCANLFVHATNSLRSRHPELAREWDSEKNLLASDQVVVGSTKKGWWNCLTVPSHTWEASVADRVRGHGCPYCAGRMVLPGDNDLATTNPLLATQWADENILAPHEVTAGSRQKVLWQCTTDVLHKWKASVRARSQGQGCPFCSGKRVLQGNNDLATLRPYLTYEWDYEQNDFLPEEVPVSSSKRAAWICLANNDHRWETFIYDRARGTQCPHCHAAAITSQGERSIAFTLEQLGLTVLSNARSVLDNSFELDLYLPAKNFAIEFNGVYWHSERFKEPNYHQSKQQACAAAGITLYQVWEDDWKSRREIVLRGIAHRLGMVDRLRKILPDLPGYYTERVGARHTKVVVLSYQDASTFLDAHHIQGGALGTYYLGLQDKQERLRAVLVIKKTGKPGELSIERYATAGVIAGGFTKLLTHAEKAYQPSHWVTFADLAVSDGRLYEDTGFHVDKILKPDYSYLVGGQRVHKFNYRLKRFRDDPGLLYQEGLTERELAALNGLVRVWDSGKVRYVKDVQVD